MGLDRLWSIAGDPNPSAFQKRLLTAAEWLGKSRKDPDHAKAFTQIVFALEAMLQLHEKRTLVSPGAAYRIAETCAYLIGVDRESRIKVAREVNDIYETRSRIVHGGSAGVPEEMRAAAFFRVAIVLSKLLTDPELDCITSAEALSDWIQQRKYQ